MVRTLNDSHTEESGRYSPYKTYAEEHGFLVREVGNILKFYRLTGQVARSPTSIRAQARNTRLSSLWLRFRTADIYMLKPARI